MKKWFLLLVVLLIGTVGGYGLVSSGFLMFDSDAELVGEISSNIFLDSEKLNSTIVVFKSSSSLKNHTLHSSCETQTEYIDNYQGLYFFELTYFGSECDNPNVTLKIGDEILVNSLFTVNLVKRATLFDFLVDYPDEHLMDAQKLYLKDIRMNGIYANYTGDNIGRYYKYMKGQRKLHEAQYKKELVDNILEGRGEKYLLPVPGYNISNTPGDLPNAARGYRADYTDGIHHGFDVHSEPGAEIVAIDDGIVVRTVRNFQYEDLSQIKRGTDLSEDVKLKNLDVLRGSQVWLKTRKGDVIFYSHLDDVSDEIKEGDMITAGTYIGSVGVTGVPEIGYAHYHLHFAIQKNPYDLGKVGSYTHDDYMAWDWLFRGDSTDYIIANKDAVFSY